MVTAQDIDSFASFARIRIARGEARSISDLLSEWEAQREDAESVEAIRKGLEDMEAGRVVALDEALANIRSKIGLDS